MKIRYTLMPIMLLLTGAPAIADQENAPTEPRTHARFVPERSDDFAWENDMVAFRAYGPALREGTENSGIDCWLKRVEYPIIDKWYREATMGKSYHQDHGEGLDNYHVGSSAGCGGTGIWLNSKRLPLETFVSWEINEQSRERTRFTLSYEREIEGVVYGESKTITIELGSRLFQVRSLFTRNGEPAAGLPICIGLTTHDGKATPFHDAQAGWIATWEKLGDSELGTGARMLPENIHEIRTVEAANETDPDQGHILIIAHTDEKGRIAYEAGYGWKKAGGIVSREQWEHYLDSRP